MREVEDGLLLRWQEDADGVYVPEGVTTIGKGLFRGNTAIRSIFRRVCERSEILPLRIVARWSV